MEEHDASGGHDNRFTCDTDKVQCPVCLLVLREAMQTPCGHRFCQTCITRVIGKSTMLKCPVDKQFSKLNQIFPDIAVRREVLSLPILCSQEECQWQGDLRDYETHLEGCQMKEVPCPFGCRTKTRRCDVDSHVETCPSRDVVCKFCKEKIEYQNIDVHHTECLKVPVECPTCGQADIMRGELDSHQHLDSGSCPETKILCPFRTMGCLYECRRADMYAHMEGLDGIQKHMSQVLRVMDNVLTRGREKDDLVARMNTRLDNIEASLQRMDRKTEVWKNQIKFRNVTGLLHWKLELRGRGSYHSPPFYTGCPGYKVRVDLDTDSVRDGNNSYSGFGLTLLRGDYDDKVMWPFNATCYITILDQKPGSKPNNFMFNVVMREVPKNRTNSKTDRLYKRGMSKMISREELMGANSRFIKQGCMYLEVSVIHCNYPAPEVSNTQLTTVNPLAFHALQGPLSHHHTSPGTPPQHRVTASPASPVVSLATLAVLP